MTEPLVSIIIPVYNVEKYLDKCLTTVVFQNYDNLQIILVDDGSTDNSLSICKRWSSKDERIEVYSKKNGGLSDARNYGLRYAKGEYISFVDSDDWISLNMISKMVSVFSENDVDMVTCQFITVNNGNAKLFFHQDKKLNIIDRKGMFKLLLEDNNMTSHVWRKMYKRNLIPKDVFEVGKNFEDILAMPILVSRCKKIASMNEGLYFYRTSNDKSIVNTISLRNIEDRFYALKKFTDTLINIEPKLKKFANRALAIKEIDIYRDLIDTRMIRNRESLSLIISLREDLREKNCRVLPGIAPKLFGYSIVSSKTLSILTYELLEKQNSLIKRGIRKFKSYVIKYKKRKAFNAKYLSGNNNLFVVLGVPDYGNLGDQALKFAEYNFIHNYFPDFKIVPVGLNDGDLIRNIKRKVKNKDIIAQQAGGNIGTLYPLIHNTQLSFLSSFKKDRVFVFPQTLYFKDDNEGEQYLKNTESIYRDMQHFLLFTRDKFSYNFAQKKLPEVDATLMPDMALSLTPRITDKRRNGVILLLRNDAEKTLSVRDLQVLLKNVKRNFKNNYIQSDTHIYFDNIDDNFAKNKIYELWDKISRSQLVITDRLHGMVFAALTNTPCIVLHSKSPKIQGVYEWIKNNKFIFLEDDINELSNMIKSALATSGCHFERKNIKEKFDQMAELINKL